MIQLHKPNALLDQPPSNQALCAKLARMFLVESIHLVRVNRFLF